MLEVDGHTLRQAIYFLPSETIRINKTKDFVTYVEVHAREVFAGANPRDVKLALGLGDKWKCCGKHQPEMGKLSRQVTLIEVPKPISRPVTREWMKSGAGEDWGTSRLG
jgi:hypothetical protein